MKNTFLCLCILLLPAGPLCAQPDSGHRIRALVYFPIGRSSVDPGFGDNRRSLETFADSLRAVVNDPEQVVSRLNVYGMASPDGSRQRNSELAGQRARALADYIVAQTGFPAEKIETVNYGENWSGLRMLIEQSDMPCKRELLHLMERYAGSGDSLRLKGAMQTFDGGKPWSWMSEHLFPSLRCGAYSEPVTMPEIADSTRSRTAGICSDTGVMQAERHVSIPTDTVAASVLTDFSDRGPQRLHPAFSLKTNLVLWAGVTPEFGISTSMPNLAAELYFARRWSVEGSYVYSDWKYFKGDKLWAVSAFSIEPRVWFRKDSGFRGFYMGIYGQYGEFDNQQDREAGRAERTGTFFSVGASLGFVQALSRHWYLEIGVKGGYRRAYTDVYDIEPPHYYFSHNLTQGKFSPGLRLNILYRFGQGRKHADRQPGK